MTATRRTARDLEAAAAARKPPRTARPPVPATEALAMLARRGLRPSATPPDLPFPAAMDEATAVLVTEMAKIQAKAFGATEDYVVTREFKSVSDEAQRIAVLRASFAVMAANGTISAEETAVINGIAEELEVSDADLNLIRADYHEQFSAVQAVRRIAGNA